MRTRLKQWLLNCTPQWELSGLVCFGIVFGVVEFDLVGLNSVWFGVVKFGLVRISFHGDDLHAVRCQDPAGGGAEHTEVGHVVNWK